MVNTEKNSISHTENTNLNKLPKKKAMVLGGKKPKPTREGLQRADSVSSTISKDSDHSSQKEFLQISNSAEQVASVPKTDLVKVNAAGNRKIESKDIHKKNLGEEFEFQIAVDKTKELDFFADMTPDLSQSRTVLIESSLPHISSKFKATEVNEEVTLSFRFYYNKINTK